MIDGTFECSDVNSDMLDEGLAPNMITVSEAELREQSISKAKETPNVEESASERFTSLEKVPSAANSTLGDALPETEELDAERCVTNAGAVGQKPSSRVQIRNIPPYLKYKQVKELLSKQLNKSVVKNIRHTGITVFFSLPTPNEAAAAVQIFDGFKMKGRILQARIAQPEQLKAKPLSNDQIKRTARERVTPLADIPYSEQLEIKMKDVKRIAMNFLKEMIVAHVNGANRIDIESLIESIRPSPRITGYRNKCEFTIGHNIDGHICVGFVGGRFAANEHFVVPVDTCDNISAHMKRIVGAFEKLVLESGESVSFTLLP
ncbi:unnamed protein product [Brugia timori]|uniref:RRM domain-containing protein n=1 Tax=Brugia timori TaxID=42155 RepID=A0A0R3Q6Y7_9BILA|nr:unnamed protein product [Brugia timori]